MSNRYPLTNTENAALFYMEKLYLESKKSGSPHMTASELEEFNKNLEVLRSKFDARSWESSLLKLIEDIRIPLNFYEGYWSGVRVDTTVVPVGAFGNDKFIVDVQIERDAWREDFFPIFLPEFDD